MEIGNYKAAIEAFTKAAEMNPNNREAMRSLGLAFELNGQTNEAISQFDRYLERFQDDPQIAFKQADYLGWSRYNYRREDAIRYYRMGLKTREDPLRRHQLAKLLARDKSTLDDALEEYRRLLKSEPGNAQIRAEYRKLLSWDKRTLSEAIREWSEVVERNPGDDNAALELARLLAQDDARTEEAIERYRKLVEKRPNDQKLRKEYARVLAKDKANLSEAREEFRTLAQGDAELETRTTYADLLAADGSTRGEALDRYRKLVAENPKDKETRLKYARLLGQKKESSKQAISQYKQVLAQDPSNGEAHAGLAKAYAWNGDNDAALYHNRLAMRTSGGRSEVADLNRQLMSGREPSVGGRLSFFYQPGDSFGFEGISVGAQAKADITPYITVEGGAGGEQYWKQADYMLGGYFSPGTQARFTSADRADLRVGYHTMRPGVSALTFLVQYEKVIDNVSLRPRIERRPKYDSFLSFVGSQSPTAAPLGAATANLLSLDVEAVLGRPKILFTPYAGWVSDASGLANAQLGLDGLLEIRILDEGPWKWSLGYRAQATHYASDHSGFAQSTVEPFPGGYFSPAFYLNQGPRLRLGHVVERSHDLELSGGPALQFQKSHTEQTAWLWGGDVRVSYVLELKEHLRWINGAGFAQISNLYSRFDFESSLAYVF